MGAACCIAARDRTIQPGSSGDILLQRNLRHSPTWSFRWDSRVGAAVEESSIGGLSDVARRSDFLDLKSATDVSAHISDGGSSFESYQMGADHKSQLNLENRDSIAKNPPVKAKQSAESSQVRDPACFELKPSPSMHSSPSLSTSSHSAQSHHHQLTHHRSGSIIEDTQTPGVIPSSNEPTRASRGRSSDGWSTHALFMSSSSHRERPSFGSDSCRYNCDKLSSRTSGRISGSVPVDFQTCGVCSKLLVDKSAWSTHKIIAGNELSVVAVLVCGHVYHAECLEVVTPEFNKYDPACPICTFGEKQTLKLFGKMLKAERGRCIKKSRSHVPDTGGSFDFDYWNGDSHEGRSPKLSTSSSLKIVGAKPFLMRHFSFGSRGSKSVSDTTSSSVRRKGLFWAKSTRE